MLACTFREIQQPSSVSDDWSPLRGPMHFPPNSRARQQMTVAEDSESTMGD